VTETVLGNALAFARHGHAVFPVNWPQRIAGGWHCSCGRRECKTPAKHPYGPFAPTGVKSATCDPDIIRRWFTRAPKANLGLSTARLVVVDADPRHGGDETLAALEREHEFPPTWRVITGSLGRHVYFACPDGAEVSCSNAEHNPVLGAGIDIRSQGGYVVAPPSVHISGRSYTWSVDHHPADVPLAEAPAWLVEKLLAHGKANGAGGPGHDPVAWAERKAGEVSEYRDMAIAQVAGKLLRAVSLDPAFVRTLVLDWNSCHCAPPLPEREVMAIFDRIAEREIRRLEAEHA
jgi:hypothetical protein